MEAGLSRKGAHSVAVKFLDPFLLSQGIATCVLAPHQSLMESERYSLLMSPFPPSSCTVKGGFPPVQKLPLRLGGLGPPASSLPG